MIQKATVGTVKDVLIEGRLLMDPMMGEFKPKGVGTHRVGRGSN